MIVIICAMEREARALMFSMEEVSAEWIEGKYISRIGKINGQKVLVMVSNAGKVNAAAAAMRAYFTVHPSVVVNIGVCGSVCDDLEQGDVVVPLAFTQYDIDTTECGDPRFFMSGIEKSELKADSRARLLTNAIRCDGVSAKYSRLCATGDSFVPSGEAREELLNMTGADICDMEAGAIAQVCDIYNVPFVAVKVVSDGLNDSVKDYDLFVSNAGPTLRRIARIAIRELSERGGA